MANITNLRRDSLKGNSASVEVVPLTITASANDTVEVLSLKKNMVIDDVKVVYKGTGSSTASLGDSGSAVRYITTASTASDGVLTANTATASSAGVITAGLGYKYLAASRLILTIAGASVSAKDYVVIVTYHFDNN